MSFIRLFLFDTSPEKSTWWSWQFYRLASTKYTSDPFHFYNELQVTMSNTKQNGGNIKNTPKMALRARKTINQEGNNTPSTTNLQENNKESLIDIRKITKEELNQNEWNDK